MKSVVFFNKEFNITLFKKKSALQKKVKALSSTVHSFSDRFNDFDFIFSFNTTTTALLYFFRSMYKRY